MLDPKQLEQAVKDAYLASENEMGWRLLASPQNVLFGADVAFIGMNPGGVEEISGHGEFAMARGSAYVDEVWPGWAKGASPLQIQVRKLFHYLDQSPEDVLAGNFVPFRSPNWASLKDKRASLGFGETLWQRILGSAKPKLIVGMGGPIAGPLSQLLDIRHLEAVDVGWGNVKGRFGSNGTTRLVILPHLSRFAIIGRRESAQGLEVLFGPTWGRGFRSCDVAGPIRWGKTSRHLTPPPSSPNRHHPQQPRIRPGLCYCLRGHRFGHLRTSVEGPIPPGTCGHLSRGLYQWRANPRPT